jgi:hypothetical protein
MRGSVMLQQRGTYTTIHCIHAQEWQKADFENAAVRLLAAGFDGCVHGDLVRTY